MDPAAEVANQEFEAGQAEAAAPAEPAAAEEPWQLSQDDWQRTEQFMQATGPFIAALAQEIQQSQAQRAAYEQQMLQQQQPQPQLDPFEPQSIQQYIDQQAQIQAQRAFQEMVGPYQGVFETVASEKGEALATAEMDSLEEQLGAFNRDVAIMLAAPLIEAGTEPVQALRACVGFAQRFESEVRQSEREKMQQEMGQLTGSSETAPFAVGAAHETERVPTGKKRYEEAVQRALARRHPINPLA